MKSKCFKIRVDVYNTDILFGINMSDEEVRETLIDYGVNADLVELAVNMPENTMARILDTGNGRQFVRIRKMNDFDFKSYVAHEIFHVACNIMSGAGVNFSEDSEEAYAYLIGYITKSFYKKLRK